MAISKIKTGSVADLAITTAKIADLAITTGKLVDDAVSDAKFSGQTGAIRPTVTGVNVVVAPSTGTDVIITGTGFTTSSTVAPIVESVSSTNIYTRAGAVTWNSSTSITANFNLTAGDYRIRVENPDGAAAISTNAILQSNADPVWTTASGSLGSQANGGSTTYSAYATETDSGAISYALVSGSLPGGYSLSTNNSIAYLSGTESGSTATTTYTFSLEATDDESQKATREFSITISHGLNNGCCFN